MEKRQGTAWRIGFFAALAVLYGGLFFLICRSGFYDVSQAHNDRVFSADDVYFVTHFFSSTLDTSPRIIKHPLLIVFGCIFTRLEELALGTITVEHHYMLIVMAQICAGWLSVAVLDRILEEQYRLRTAHALLLCAVFALSFSTLFYTFVAESYIWSALVLLLSFYFARRQNLPVTVLLGALAAGITITNGALWAVIVLCSGGTVRRRLAALALGGGLFCGVVLLTPLGGQFFASLLPGALGSAHNYSDHFPPLELLRRVFFAFFGSTGFYLDTEYQSAFGEFVGDALSFLPSAPLPVTAAALAWLALLVWAALRYRRSPLLWAPLAVLGANLILHGVIQYGLKEAFLYSLHHLPAQILIAALPLTQEASAGERRAVTAGLAVYLACLVLLNFSGYLVLLNLSDHLEMAKYIVG